MGDYSLHCDTCGKNLNDGRGCPCDDERQKVVSVRQEAWVNGEKIFTSSSKPDAPAWRVGDRAVWHGVERAILALDGNFAWVTDPEGGNHMTVFLAELTRPAAPKRRKVTLEQYTMNMPHGPQKVWAERIIGAYHDWRSTGHTHEFEVEET